MLIFLFLLRTFVVQKIRSIDMKSNNITLIQTNVHGHTILKSLMICICVLRVQRIEMQVQILILSPNFGSNVCVYT